MAWESLVKIYLCILIAVAIGYLCKGEVIIEDGNRLTWCTISLDEQWKCLNFSKAVARDAALFGSDMLRLNCTRAGSKEECMTYLDQEKAQITVLDAGEVFVGGRYHSLIPIMHEIYQGGEKSYYAVAVVKRNDPNTTHISSLRDLRGKRACFAGVGTQAGWVIPVHALMQDGGMEIVDCNNHVKSTIEFFGPSCAVNSLVAKYNPIGDNSDRLCQLCIGPVPGGRCTSADPYAGFEGALRCLVEAGDVAFLKHSTVEEMTQRKSDLVGVTQNDFELLCKDGTRRDVSEYRGCNWGLVPGHAVVTTSAQTPGTRRQYQRFLKKAVQLYRQPGNYPNQTSAGRDEYRDSFTTTSTSTTTTQAPDDWQPRLEFSLFRSPVHHNLLLQDAATDLFPLPEPRQTYSGYLGSALATILAVRACPVRRMTLCVTSDPELDKCIKMKTALKAQLLKPEMVCYKGHSQIHCMQAVRSGTADVAVLDAGDVYTAGLNYELVPFVSEVYNLGRPEYYVVAVAKEQDPDTELTYLKGKYTCHTGINTGAGWVVPLAFLISNGWIRSYGCNSVRAAAEYFGKSCVPGALSAEYNTDVPYDNMCDLCHGASYRYCRRDASEDYYGNTGAFRCLVEGGGDVAFVKHTTVMENTDGKRKEWWARNALTDDFELLCPDGKRAPTQDYRSCNLGSVKANAVVTRGGAGYNDTEIRAFTNLLVYAQQFYGRKDYDDFSFSMFYSPPPFSDLIFQDATQQLQVVDPSLREYSAYLGRDFMRARRIVDCHAGASWGSRNTLGCLLVPIVVFLW